MKNKFYIIEDRSDRALRYFGKEGINALKQTDGVIILSSLPTPLSEIEDGLIIFAHKSLLVSTGQLGTLYSYAQEKRKYLVLFSGGQSSSVYINDHCIDINAKDFYSSKLIPFLKRINEAESQKIELLALIYGDCWTKPYLMEYQHIRWEYPNMDDMPDEVNDRFYEISEILQGAYQQDVFDDTFITSQLLKLSH